MGRKGKEKNCIFGVRRKGKEREGKKNVFWFGREMGRTKLVFPVWEGNGKEILKIFGMGGKWEGINVFFQRRMEKGRKKLGKVSKIWPKMAENW